MEIRDRQTRDAVAEVAGFLARGRTLAAMNDQASDGPLGFILLNTRIGRVIWI